MSLNREPLKQTMKMNRRIKEEQERGFSDEEQRKDILSIYESAKERVTKEYSKPGVATNRSQPIAR